MAEVDIGALEKVTAIGDRSLNGDIAAAATLALRQNSAITNYPKKNKPIQSESPETPNKYLLKDFLVFLFSL